MTILLLILVLAAAAGALRMAACDKRPRWTPPASHRTDSAWLPPGHELTHH